MLNTSTLDANQLVSMVKGCHSHRFLFGWTFLFPVVSGSLVAVSTRHFCSVVAVCCCLVLNVACSGQVGHLGFVVTVVTLALPWQPISTKWRPINFMVVKCDNTQTYKHNMISLKSIHKNARVYNKYQMIFDIRNNSGIRTCHKAKEVLISG